jgi:nitrous oxidase accessory protein
MNIGRKLPAALMAAGVFFIATGSVAAVQLVVAPAPQALQRAIAQAAPGDTLQLQAGTYPGPVVIDRPLTLQGIEGSVLDGGGQGRVLTVAAVDVTVKGITLRNSGDQLSTEDSGIFVTPEGDRARILDNHLQHNLIGIYLKGPEQALVRNNRITGRQDLRMNERGNGIHLWNTPGSIVEDNQVRFGRDGIFVTSSRDNTFIGNHLSELRFAIHYMYTNSSTVSDNISSNNHVGYALMYSTSLKVMRNRSIGDRDRGVFFNFTNESEIAGNRVTGGPEKCVFVYNSNINQIHGNHFQGCQIGMHFTAGSEQNELWHNSFVGNRTQVKYVGTRHLEWSRAQRGNYWSNHIAFDLDGDGIAERPFRPNSVADQIIWRNPKAKILVNSPILQILQWAQSRFPALHPGGVQDSFPLMQPIAQNRNP